MRLLTIVLAALFVVGCNEATPAAPAETAAAAPTTANGAAGLSGTVLERIDTDQYSYLRMQAGDREIWAAVPRAAVETGTEVTVHNPMEMKDFESKTLGRTFEAVYFGTLGSGAAAGAAPAPAAQPAAAGENPHAGMDMGQGMAGVDHPAPSEAADVGDLSVPKAEGENGYTVAEVHAKRGELAGKQVQVRGKVVKYNAEILGKNWLHIRDASGEPDKGTHDLTVTTQQPAAVGQTVLVTGTVATDKDFGAGYSYPVIVEDAQLEQ